MKINKTSRTAQYMALAFLMGCKSPKVKFDNGVESNLGSHDYIIKNLQLQENKYSLLMFLTGFTDEKISVKNCNVELYNDEIKTNKIQSFAKYFRINNTCNIEIYDSRDNFSFIIKSKFASKYKFIYLRKNHKNKYEIIYTNKHIRIL